jgi:dihydropteroate synthase
MEYHEAIHRLERLRRLRPKLGTETTAGLLAHLGDPHEGLTCVQVAGSNGKGSTASVLARILREAGLSVGLYTSPDLNDRRERVRVDGEKITKRAVCRFVEDIWPHVVDRSVAGDAPTFFEACTALALWEFGREDVDVAVLEVGIGGRYDATSVVDPVASAVTSVSLEHTDIIGDTVEEIARDKATVAPAERPLVTGATGEALAVVREETDVVTIGGPESGDDADGDEEAPNVRAAELEMVGPAESSVSLVGPDWEVTAETPLLGQHQAINVGIAAALARQVGDALGTGVESEAIAAGIRNVTWPGRFEVMGQEPLTVLDGAHNPDACAKLAALLDRYDYDALHLVVGAMRDKDHGGMVRALPAADRVLVAEPAVERAQASEVLAAVFESESDGAIQQCDSVLDAVGRACRTAGEDDCVLVTGSLHTVAEARDRWTRTPTAVETDSVARARSVMESADVPADEQAELADRMVSRTIRLCVRPASAERLRETMGSVGGTCAVSGIEATDQHVACVLSGTRAQFLALVRDLRGRSGECRHLASQVRGALADRQRPAATGGDYPWSDGTAVMGILNVTPDSFHDGGEYDAVDDAVARAEAMVADGADIVDVGGESTRPGAEPVPAEIERERVLPVLERLDGLDATISIDTRKPAVAAAALDAGADLVNDVTGLADASMRRVVAEHDAPAVVMHSRSVPVDPDRTRTYDDVVTDVLGSLSERLLLAERAGIDRSKLIVDPGLGFGKTAAESFALLDRLGEFRALGTPVMVGHSHKSMFERVSGSSDDRFAPTVAATAMAAERGASVIRVHDVAPNAAAVSTAAHTAGSE